MPKHNTDNMGKLFVMVFALSPTIKKMETSTALIDTSQEKLTYIIILKME